MEGTVPPVAVSTVLGKKQAVNQHEYTDEAERRLFQAEREGEEKSDGWSRARCKTAERGTSAGRAGRAAYVRPFGRRS